MTIADIRTNAHGGGARGVSRWAGAVALSGVPAIGVLPAGAEPAVPEHVPGSDFYRYTIEESEVTGHAGGSV